MKRRLPTPWFRSAALIVALVLAQTAAAGHIDLDDSHATGSVCTICLAVAHFAGGNVAAAAAFAVQADSNFLVEDAPDFILGVRTYHQLARGPPRAS